mmetsp:Transcript_20512/g.48552  ORF Transcript_20512/g.48552 Transcript_20512/m.48552 type:complete len:339 (+) Transcript_20512:289-1305(+)
MISSRRAYSASHVRLSSVCNPLPPSVNDTSHEAPFEPAAASPSRPPSLATAAPSRFDLPLRMRRSRATSNQAGSWAVDLPATSSALPEWVSHAGSSSDSSNSPSPPHRIVGGACPDSCSTRQTLCRDLGRSSAGSAAGSSLVARTDHSLALAACSRETWSAGLRMGTPSPEMLGRLLGRSLGRSLPSERVVEYSEELKEAALSINLVTKTPSSRESGSSVDCSPISSWPGAASSSVFDRLCDRLAPQSSSGSGVARAPVGSRRMPSCTCIVPRTVTCERTLKKWPEIRRLATSSNSAPSRPTRSMSGHTLSPSAGGKPGQRLGLGWALRAAAASASAT